MGVLKLNAWAHRRLLPIYSLDLVTWVLFKALENVIITNYEVTLLKLAADDYLTSNVNLLYESLSCRLGHWLKAVLVDSGRELIALNQIVAEKSQGTHLTFFFVEANRKDVSTSFDLAEDIKARASLLGHDKDRISDGR